MRGLMGATNPLDAAPGTVRGDLGLHPTENLVHGSDSAESAQQEIELFFPDL
ncbi:MAG TPA: nucleoside-diphosphate kinase [Acidimicrobiales bacterium]|nr:nucleoside-diphosphate kinase [Acidimicrobiales bacterium]